MAMPKEGRTDSIRDGSAGGGSSTRRTTDPRGAGNTLLGGWFSLLKGAARRVKVTSTLCVTESRSISNSTLLPAGFVSN
jgi:hypothetical protein